jgi:hypothetical protein
MVRKQALLATLTLATLAVVNGQDQVPFLADLAHGNPDPYMKYSSLHDIPAVDIDEKPLNEVGIFTRGKKLTLVTNVASF